MNICEVEKSKFKKYAHAGRPEGYKEEYCEEVIELGKKPMSFVEIACYWKVCVDTLHEWCYKHPNFSEACARAKAEHDNWFRKQIREGLWETTDTEQNGSQRTTRSKRMNGLTMKQYAFLHFGYSEKSMDNKLSGLPKKFYETQDVNEKQRILDESLCDNLISGAQYESFSRVLSGIFERTVGTQNDKRIEALENSQKDK